jgi:hypothetical protein
MVITDLKTGAKMDVEMAKTDIITKINTDIKMNKIDTISKTDMKTYIKMDT